MARMMAFGGLDVEVEDPRPEVVHEPIEFEMDDDLKSRDMEVHLVMDRRHRLLEDGEWIMWARRQIGRDDLYVYHHFIEDTFVLVQMLWWEPHRVCAEIKVLPGHPDRGGGLSLPELRIACRYGHELMDEVKQDILRRREERIRRDQLDVDSFKDVREHYRRKDDHASLAALSSSPMYTARENRSEIAQELEGDLNNRSKGRVITHS